VTDNFNPYQAPKANVDVADQPREIEPVGKGRRFATYLIDVVGVYTMAFVIGVVVMLAFGQTGLDKMLAINDFVLGALLTFTYYLLFEGLWARTPAKFILGTVVVTEDGKKPSFGAVVLRTLCRHIPFEPFSFFGERGWHDKLSNTYVVSTRG
jgi:uncharacterized RDD family membrane protein YckC